MLSNNYVYSPSTNSVFCLPCSLFAPINSGKNGCKDRHQLSQFVNQGCKDDKRMHESSTATMTWNIIKIQFLFL